MIVLQIITGEKFVFSPSTLSVSKMCFARRPPAVIISGPSGVGKTTLINKVRRPDKVKVKANNFNG